MRRYKQTQVHEKICKFVVSKFVKLSDELIIRQFNFNGLGKNVLLKKTIIEFLGSASASQPNKICHLLRSLWD